MVLKRLFRRHALSSLAKRFKTFLEQALDTTS
jgi:hypothetical protein